MWRQRQPGARRVVTTGRGLGSNGHMQCRHPAHGGSCHVTQIGFRSRPYHRGGSRRIRFGASGGSRDDNRGDPGRGATEALEITVTSVQEVKEASSAPGQPDGTRTVSHLTVSAKVDIVRRSGSGWSARKPDRLRSHGHHCLAVPSPRSECRPDAERRRPRRGLSEACRNARRKISTQRPEKAGSFMST